MLELDAICVYCGSRPGTDPSYVHAARALGRLLAERGITLVFGAGSVGIMGAVADAVLAHGGDAVGVIPYGLVRAEVRHGDLSALHVVETMHERKAMMMELSDAFITAPGGFGTLEELFEVLTWGQLGIHQKPVGLLDVGVWWQPLLAMLDHTLEQKFIEPFQRELVICERTPEGLLDALGAYTPHTHAVWRTRER